MESLAIRPMVELPWLPVDAWRVIFEIFINKRPVAVWVHDAAGVKASVRSSGRKRQFSCREQSIRTLRVICKQWACVANDLVTTIRTPVYENYPITVPTTFPRVSIIYTWPRGWGRYPKDVLEEILRQYAALGTMISVIDNGHPSVDKPLNVHGLFVGWRFIGRIDSWYINPGLAFPAWPCRHDRKKLYASFSSYCWTDNRAEALVRADCVEFASIESFILGSVKFRASALCFRLGWVGECFPIANWYQQAAIVDLLNPDRWEDKKLPSIYILHTDGITEGPPMATEIKKLANMTFPLIPHVFTHTPEALVGNHPFVSHSDDFDDLVG